MAIPDVKLHKTVIEPSKGWFGVNLKDLWIYRELFVILAQREVQLRYRQTILGVAWVVLQPLMTTAIFTIIFGRLLNISSGNVSYELFVFAGLLPWGIFSQSVQRAGVSLTRDIRLITRVFFSANYYSGCERTFNCSRFSGFASGVNNTFCDL